MVLEKQKLTVANFEAFIKRPENADKEFEFIYGEIYEVVSNPKSSKIAARILGFIFIYLQQNDIGHITGADGGYQVGETERYIPDVGFISYEKQPELSYKDGYVPNSPNFVVEVVSPANTDKELHLKVGHYLEAGALVWVVYPETKQVAIYEQGKPVVVKDEIDRLDGGSVFPEFTLKVKDIFGA